MSERDRLEAERVRIQAEWNLIHEKLSRLGTEHALETDAATKYRLEHQIAVAEQELQKRTDRLDEIERLLDGNSPLLIPGDNKEEIIIAINNLESPYKVVPIDSKFYIEPDIYTHCQEEIQQPSGLLPIQAAHGMGKTSLLERLVQYAKEDLQYRVVRIDLGLADISIMQDLDLFLQWFCEQLCSEFHPPIDVKEALGNTLGAKTRCINFIKKYCLKEGCSPLLICIDNLELIDSYPNVCNDFLSLLRVCHEKRDTTWNSLRMILFYVYPAKTKDINHSPFNVKKSEKLSYFNKKQVQKLVALHDLDWHDRDIDRLMKLVGGHPFLIRVALYEAAQRRISVDDIVTTADRENGLFGKHLERLLSCLEREPNLSKVMREVVNSNCPLFIASASVRMLQNLGSIEFNSDGRIEPANQLYRLYFYKRL